MTELRSRAAPDGDAVAVTIGGFRLLRLIGKGAVGAVHMAAATDGTTVALKVLRLNGGGSGDGHAAATQASDDGTPPGGAKADARRRFLAEVGAAQRLRHPGIVQVLAAGEEGGTAWIAMELLHGCDLTRYTRPSRLLPEAAALRIAERLALALTCAHTAGVVHRDIKPANVVVDWAADRVTLTDFGVAHVADGERTRTGLVLGSPSYMAPELLAGATASAAADLYALGVTLFQLLTGRLPHDHGSLGELLRQVASVPAPDVRTVKPQLPATLAELVAQLLAKRAEDRPQGARQVAERLLPMRLQLERAPMHAAAAHVPGA